MAYRSRRLAHRPGEFSRRDAHVQATATNSNRTKGQDDSRRVCHAQPLLSLSKSPPEIRKASPAFRRKRYRTPLVLQGRPDRSDGCPVNHTIQNVKCVGVTLSPPTQNTQILLMAITQPYDLLTCKRAFLQSSVLESKWEIPAYGILRKTGHGMELG